MNILETDDPCDLFTGCIRTESNGNGLLLHRHTAKQVDYYDGANESWAIRSRCTAGITLSIETDASKLEFVGRVREGARKYAGFDVDVDGYHVHGIRMETSDDTQTLLFGNFDSRKTRQIRVAFPQSAFVELDEIRVDDDASVSPLPTSTTRYLAIGDSITQGMDARGPASIYTYQLSRMLYADLLNLGVGGHIYDLDALDDDLPYEPDLVTVAYGTNDWNKGVTQDESGLVVEYLTRLKNTVAKSSTIHVLTPLWRAIGQEQRPGGNLIEFSGAIADAAGSVDGINIIDGLSLVPHLDHLFADGTHPNDEGFLHYALNLAKAIG